MTALPCNRANCDGTVMDGYCQSCGMAPAKAAPSAAASPPPDSPTPTSAAAGPVGTRASRLSAGSRATTHRRAASRQTRRRGIGAGLVDIADVKATDPAKVVMADPTVPEDKRFCGNCSDPVGRTVGKKAGRESGFCANCRTRFDYAPKLAPGDLIAGQYEIAGCLAHGGLGWIYLAEDRNVSGRWCVLKGLLDKHDPAAVEAAVAEKRFLAEVTHPNIVEIYNFVSHDGFGYIVMEYVGGPSVKQIAKARRNAGNGPLSPDVAIAYLRAALPALGYLHDQGLVYCDFKPDNIIHTGDHITLIDLGAVRRIDDDDAAIFGTPGYQAPEVPTDGVSVESDLYTIGRALAVLILDWPDWQKTTELPTRADHPVLVEHESLWRFLTRACHEDPSQRFHSADEMSEALHGVLCAVAACIDEHPRPRASAHYTAPLPVPSSGPGWLDLPVPIVAVDPNNPPLLPSGADAPAVVYTAQTIGPVTALADQVSLVRALVATGALPEAAALASSIDASVNWSDPARWEETTDLVVAAAWHRGLVDLAQGFIPDAFAEFSTCFNFRPGELACAYAVASCALAIGDPAHVELAISLFDTIATTDPSWAGAVTGLSRALALSGRPTDANAVCAALPEGHPLRAQVLTSGLSALDRAQEITVDDIAPASAAVRAGVNTRDLLVLDATLHTTVLRAAQAGRKVPPTLNGVATEPKVLAARTAETLEALAAATPDNRERVALLDQASRTRPWRLW